MANNKDDRPLWKEPAVAVAVVAAIVIAAAAVAFMYRFATEPGQGPKRAPGYVVRIDGQTVDLDAVDAQAFAALVSKHRDNLEALEQLETTILRSIGQGRKEEAVPSIPPTAEIRVRYSPKLVQRVEKLFLMAEEVLEIDPAAYFELGLYEFYKEREERASAEKASKPDFTFGTAYGFLGVTGVDTGEYGVPFQLFSKVVEATPEEADHARDPLHALALGNLGLIYRARGDYKKASALLSEADEMLSALGIATESQQVKKYIEIVRLESAS